MLQSGPHNGETPTSLLTGYKPAVVLHVRQTRDHLQLNRAAPFLVSVSVSGLYQHFFDGIGIGKVCYISTNFIVGVLYLLLNELLCTS